MIKNYIFTTQIHTGSVVDPDPDPDDLYVLDPDQLVRSTDPDPSIIKQK